MSGDRTSPRYEMIASTRRRWLREQKLAILAEVDAPGGSVSEVARRHGLHTSLLFRWRRDLAKRTRSASASPEQSFLPVRLPPPSVPALPAPVRSGTIEVVLAGGRMLRVGADVDTAVLVRIVEALETDR
ncbi:MAG TPA: transposase [Vicinamibacterales bacterium]|nr:transposase [Vicinamibacterales bacterium]